HPGYGFLSENPAFAEACAEAGLIFVGPSAEAMREMGDKARAKAVMAAAGVPCVPGYDGADQGDVALLKAAQAIGWPVMIKAVAGGGGRGMRLVGDEVGFAGALAAARAEAKLAFGDDRVLLEKAVAQPRHVEIQVFADRSGNAVHLGERDCSMQRRHQKLIEEAPSPAVSPALRESMGAAAVRAAQSIGYEGAGTLEFLLAGDDWYFMEINTRLQVEHPVTELVTRRDLVKAQLLVAAGEPLPFTQADLKQEGHAMEVRVYAEDAARGFLPSTGTIGVYREPVAPNVRVDSGIDAGSEVSVHYDPMLAKLIVWGRDRQEAIARMAWALRHYVILGVTTNIDFLRAVVSHPKHVAGEIHTRFLDENPIEVLDSASPPDEAWIAAVLAAHSGGSRKAGAEVASAEAGPWRMAGAWKAY
ncbi:MAG: ATP-grasp domain-containing protein, partial [Phycisphaerales bacterium]|nr:ATP-grasp domain-containing protein [Phycisphaerales bacterium]